METETNLVDGDDTGLPTVADENGVNAEANEETNEIQFDEEGNPIDEEEEIDLDDDLKLKVSKAAAQKLKELKEGSLRQADYTRKTQELADLRRSFEAERNSVVSATNEELYAFAEIANLQGQLAQYQRIDWSAWNEQDPFEAQKAFMQFQQAKDAFSGAQGRLNSARNQREAHQQQETARLMEQGREVLAREIGWNDELKAKLTDHAISVGLSREDLSDLEANPAAVRILKDAYEWRQHQAKTQAANRHVQAQQAQPAATVSARRAPPTGLDDRLSTEEWVRRRNAQARKG